MRFRKVARPALRTRRSLIVAIISTVLACSDMPTSTDIVEHSRGNFGAALSSEDASATNSDPYWLTTSYYDRDPLAIFGVNYDTFGANPESVTDEQFVDYADASVITTQEVPQVENDDATVYAYTSTYVGCSPQDPTNPCEQSTGPGGIESAYSNEFGGTTIQFAGYCADRYNTCTPRCRRIRTSKGRALCWAGCMAVYAWCRGHR